MANARSYKMIPKINEKSWVGFNFSIAKVKSHHQFKKLQQVRSCGRYLYHCLPI